MFLKSPDSLAMSASARLCPCCCSKKEPRPPSACSGLPSFGALAKEGALGLLEV